MNPAPGRSWPQGKGGHDLRDAALPPDGSRCEPHTSICSMRVGVLVPATRRDPSVRMGRRLPGPP